MRKLKMDELGRVDIQEFKDQKKLPLIMVLDNVRSMHNVGSVFRTADGFAIEAIYLVGITGQPPHREIEKTALGATKSVEWLYFNTIEEALQRLKSDHYQLIAVEQAENSIPLNKFTPDNQQKYALIFGNEVSGVSEIAIKIVDHCIEIPQFGTKHSFNIVVSAGIVLWDLFSKISIDDEE